jgi:hypothetical protein
VQHKRIGLGLGLAGLAMLLGLACGSSEEKKGEDPPPYPDKASFCRGVADQICAKDVGIAEACSPDEASCKIKAQQLCADGKLEFATNQTDPYQFKPAEACIGAVKAAYGDKKLTSEDFTAMHKICDRVFSKALGEGETCAADGECKEGLICWTGGKSTGSCEVPKDVLGGELCSDKGAKCPDTQYCQSNGKCGSKEPVGTACGVGIICQDTLRCAGTTVNGAGGAAGAAGAGGAGGEAGAAGAAGEAGAAGAAGDMGTAGTAGDMGMAGAGGMTGTTASTCAAKLAKFQPCAASSECESGICGEVVGSGKQCVSEISFTTNEPSCAALR